jgi:FkbM family methyltransferase
LFQFKDIKRKNIGFRVMDTEITSSWSYWNLFCNEAWEGKTLDVINEVLPQDGLLFDIGAWIGPMSLWAAKSKQALVVAIEPDLEAFRQLNANVNENNLNNVTCLNLAVSHDGKPAQLGIQKPGDSCSSLTQKGQSSQEVETITLTQLFEQYGIPDLIKMDIEGGESLLFNEPDQQIFEIPMIISLHPQWYAPDTKIAETLSRWHMTNIESTNYLCIPKE